MADLAGGARGGAVTSYSGLKQARRTAIPPESEHREVQTLVIEGWLPSPVMNGSRQKHWATVRKEVQQTKTMAWASARQAGWRYVGDDAPKMRMSIVLVFGNHRRRDTDNLYARVKHLVDGLKPWIVDDDTEHLELVVTAEVRPGIKQTEITLESSPRGAPG